MKDEDLLKQTADHLKELAASGAKIEIIEHPFSYIRERVELGWSDLKCSVEIDLYQNERLFKYPGIDKVLELMNYNERLKERVEQLEHLVRRIRALR
jgi:hypothetical protein